MGRKKVRRTGKGGKIIQGKKVQNKNAKCGIVRKNQGIKCRNEKSPCIQAKKNERKNYENERWGRALIMQVIFPDAR